MRSRTGRYLALAVMLVISTPGCRDEVRSDRSETSPDTAVPAGQTAPVSPASVRTNVDQHIIFTGIIAFLKQKDESVRFVMPVDAMGMHKAWIMAPKGTATTSAGLKADAKPRKVNGVDVDVWFVDGYQIDLGQTVAKVDVSGLTDLVAETSDWLPNDPAKDVLRTDLKADPASASLVNYGDLGGGALVPSWADQKYMWRYDEDATPPANPTCHILAEEWCHASTSASGKLRIVLRKGTAEEWIEVAPPSGDIEVRIGHTTSDPAPTTAVDKDDEDEHFRMYYELAKNKPTVAAGKKLPAPFRCEGMTAPGQKLQDKHGGHTIDYPFSVTGGGKNAAPGSINCPPDWWCAPNC